MPVDVKPTHAGLVVYRGDPAAPEFLIITARRDPSAWVLPKGHIEKDETPEAAARRETLEETGVAADIVDDKATLGTVTYYDGNEYVRVIYFLGRRTSEKASLERRSCVWLPFDDAENRLSHAESKNMLRSANQRLSRSHAADTSS
jgi:8-oxo-dGTP pyrophosphatase MutT (NUDIX family)